MLQRRLLLPPLKIQHHMLHSNSIPKNPQPNNNPRRLITEETMMPPLLARMHIAYMQFHKRDPHPEQRIPDRHGGMREAARVDDDAVDVAASCVDAVDQGAFVVGLEGVERGVHGGGVGFA